MYNKTIIKNEAEEALPGGNMYRIRKTSWGHHIDFMLLDLICLWAAFFVTVFIRNGMVDVFHDPDVLEVGIVLALMHFCVGFFFESYKSVLRRGALQEFKYAIQHVSLMMAGMFAYFFIVKRADHFSRFVLLALWAEGIIILLLARTAWKKMLQKRMETDAGDRNLFLITRKNRVAETLEVLEKHSSGVYHIVGMCMLDDEIGGGTIQGIPVVTRGKGVDDFTRECAVDEVLLDLQDDVEIQKETERFLEMGITVHQCLTRVSKENVHTKTVENFGGYTVLSTSIRIASGRQLFLKRLMDIAGGLAGVVVTGILTIFIGPAIYIKSPGPIFFSQERVGKNGRRFRIYKFWSMYPDAEARKKELMDKNNIKDGMMFKMDDDPRIIKGVGNFIRKTSLDEFPQFWNVLKGDMSLVGTRPPTVDEWEKYDLHHRRRLAAKPGLTGMWQVSGRSSITDFEKVVSLDTQYITEWSLGLDIKILFKTVEVIFKGEGAA